MGTLHEVERLVPNMNTTKDLDAQIDCLPCPMSCRQYIQHVLNPILLPLINEVLAVLPRDPQEFFIRRLREIHARRQLDAGSGQARTQLFAHTTSAKPTPCDEKSVQSQAVQQDPGKADLFVDLVREREVTAALRRQVASLETCLKTAMEGAKVATPGRDNALRRHQSRNIDLEAQLLDANEARREMKAEIAAQGARLDELQRRLVDAESRARNAGSGDTKHGKLVTNGLLSWLPTMQQHPKHVKNSVSANVAKKMFAAAEADESEVFRMAFLELDHLGEIVHAIRNEMGQTLLHVSLANGSGETARLILEQRKRWAANLEFVFSLHGTMLERQVLSFVNGVDKHGCTALHYLCQRSDPGEAETITALLEGKADVMARDLTGTTPSIECAKSGNIVIMKLLCDLTSLEVVSDVDDCHRSSLYWAARTGHGEVVEFLLSVRADADGTDLEGHTAIDAAIAAGHDDILNLLTAALDNLGFEGDEHVTWPAYQNGSPGSNMMSPDFSQNDFQRFAGSFPSEGVANPSEFVINADEMSPEMLMAIAREMSGQ